MFLEKKFACSARGPEASPGGLLGTFGQDYMVSYKYFPVNIDSSAFHFLKSCQMALEWSKMVPNGLGMVQNGAKWPCNGLKWCQMAL